MSDSISKYIKLFEDELNGLRAVGVSEPEEKDPVDVTVSFEHDVDHNPSKSVQVSADSTMGGDPDALRDVLHNMNVPIPDEDAEPNETGVWVSVGDNGNRVAVIADNEKADELLDVLKNAGLYKGDNNA